MIHQHICQNDGIAIDEGNTTVICHNPCYKWDFQNCTVFLAKTTPNSKLLSKGYRIDKENPVLEQRVMVFPPRTRDSMTLIA